MQNDGGQNQTLGGQSGLSSPLNIPASSSNNLCGVSPYAGMLPSGLNPQCLPNGAGFLPPSHTPLPSANPQMNPGFHTGAPGSVHNSAVLPYLHWGAAGMSDSVNSIHLPGIAQKLTPSSRSMVNIYQSTHRETI